MVSVRSLNHNTLDRLVDVIDTSASSTLNTDNSESLNLQNFREALASWDVGSLKQQVIKRFEDYLSGNIDYLNLSLLGLKTLPDAILRIPQLEIISLSDNCLKAFPKVLASCRCLEVLNLAGNYFKWIPDYLGNLEHLTRLDISDNPLDCDQLPQSLWEIPKLKLNLQQEKHYVPARFKAFSPEFAQKWSLFEKENGSGFFKTWFLIVSSILWTDRMQQQRPYFSQRLKFWLNSMIKHRRLRQRYFECTEESISTCHDRILFSMFEMECKYLEEEISQGTLSKAEIYSSIERMYHFHCLQEKALQYLNLIHIQNGHKETTEEESIETVLDFISSSHNTFSMPVDTQQIVMFYPSVSKATEQSIQEAVKSIEDEKEKNKPKILIDYIQEKPFWRIFLYPKNKDFIDHQLAVFDQRMELLDARRNECNDDEYINSVNNITEERRRTESAIYIMLTSQFFDVTLKDNVSQI
ncbi:unnamed protein product, partial [Rotaria socialis]